MDPTRILVYGAGPLGSLFAVRLHGAGHQVGLLARGQRLSDLREHGVVLQDGLSGQRTTTRLPIVEALAPNDLYDLVLVVMRKNQAMEILPVLAANRKVPTVVFLMNNFAGPDPLVEALGAERVMLGFPTTGGERIGHVIRLIPQSGPDRAIPIGEVDGRVTERTQTVAATLERMDGFRIEIRRDMDAWLKYHVATLISGLAPALYACGTDIDRLGRTRDALVLAIRATREAFRTLRQAGIPVTPAPLRMVEWLPEPVLLALTRWGLATETMKVSGEGHARAARDEMKYLADELLAFARGEGAVTPTMDALHRHFDPATPPLPDGTSRIPLHWSGVAGTVAAGAVAAAGARAVSRRIRSGTADPRETGQRTRIARPATRSIRR
jgi:ketopantoate reductase